MNAYVFALYFSAFLALKGRSSAFPDWLVTPIKTASTVERVGEDELVITNGLITRKFFLKGNVFATTDYYSHEKKSSLLRGIGPEAIVRLSGTSYYIGGFKTNITGAYLNRTALNESPRIAYEKRFYYVSYKIKDPEAPFSYTPKRGAPEDIVWPPKGKRLDVYFRPVKYPSSALVTVHYEIYDGIPLLVKWVTVTAKSSTIKLDGLVVESLRVNMQWADISVSENVYTPKTGSKGYGWMDVDIDEAHGGIITWNMENQNIAPGSFQARVDCSYTRSDMSIPLGNRKFKSFRVHELIIGSSDPERAGLSRKRKLRLLAPHTQENPIFFHSIKLSSVPVRKILQQMSEVGFEMLVYSFGSGFSFESNDTQALLQLKRDIAYANALGIEVGGYDLIALTRHVKSDWMAMPEKSSACFASPWKDYLLRKVVKILSYTNMTMIETDGPYGGYTCDSKSHEYHAGKEDSVYWQNHYQKKFYKALRSLGIYINQPDLYFYSGGNKSPMGYNENQFSLSRWLDISISRQGMYDDLRHFIPSQGWMFLPITDYHGGGEAAAFIPLQDHLTEYEWGLAQYFGAGVNSCFRGDRLFDSEESKAIVKKWVDFYKKYRRILTSDVIQVRRGDMQSIDSFLHVNPFLKGIKGLAMVFNPTLETIKDALILPLYYTGLEYKAEVSFEGNPGTVYELDRRYEIEIPIVLSPLNITWILISETKG